MPPCTSKAKTTARCSASAPGPLRVFPGIQTYDPEGDKAQSSGPILHHVVRLRTRSTTEADARRHGEERPLAGQLDVKYEGIVTVSKLGDTKCHKLVRKYDKVEEDDLGELDLYFDTEHWLQVGSHLKTPKEEEPRRILVPRHRAESEARSRSCSRRRVCDILAPGLRPGPARGDADPHAQAAAGACRAVSDCAGSRASFQGYMKLLTRRPGSRSPERCCAGVRPG